MTDIAKKLPADPEDMNEAPRLDPVSAAIAVTPFWMLRIREFDALEVHPCCVVSFADEEDFIEQCEPRDAHFWSVYGHCVVGGLDCFDDFPTEAEAVTFAERLRKTYPHLNRY